MTLFRIGLMPRTLTSPKPAVSTVTPGVINAKADQRRLFTGKFSSALVLMFDENCGDTVSVSGASAVTSTLVLVSPTRSCTETLVLWLTCTSTFLAMNVPKPGLLNVTVYEPGSSSGATKSPAALERNTARLFVASLTIVTVVPGTTAPL